MQKQRERCARTGKETSRLCGSQIQMHNIFICYTAGYTESTLNSDKQTIAVVINTIIATIRMSVLNAHLIYENNFRGLLGAQGSRLPLSNG